MFFIFFIFLGRSLPESKPNASLEVGSPDSSPPHSLKSEEAEPAEQQQDVSGSKNKSVAEKEESFHLLGLTQHIEDDQEKMDSPPEEAPDQDAAEQEEEWEDNDDDGEEGDGYIYFFSFSIKQTNIKALTFGLWYISEFSGKTPAFVKEKRTFYQPDSPTLTPVSKKVQLGYVLASITFNGKCSLITFY